MFRSQVGEDMDTDQSITGDWPDKKLPTNSLFHWPSSFTTFVHKFICISNYSNSIINDLMNWEMRYFISQTNSIELIFFE